MPYQWELDAKYYQADKYPQFGKSNPAEMKSPFWREMVKFRWPASVPCHRYQDDSDSGTVWCFCRYGQSITPLPDGGYRG